MTISSLSRLLPLLALSCGLALCLAAPGAAQPDGDDWEAWSAGVTGAVRFEDAEVERFEGDEDELMVVKAAYGEDETRGPYFAVVTLAKLPDTARVFVSLVFHDQQLPWIRADVTEGVARCLLGPYPDRKVLAGRYEVVVAFFPHRQRRRVLNFPGVPLEDRTISTRVSVHPERLADESIERRRYYTAYRDKIRILENEQATNRNSALDDQKFIIGRGASATFDVGAWRAWVSDWRERMGDRVGETMRAECDAQVLAKRYPDAYTILQGIAGSNMLLNRAYSRQVYEHHGRAVHPDDEVGIDDVGAATLEGKIRDGHRAFQEFEW